jgi:hypothetical protein
MDAGSDAPVGCLHASDCFALTDACNSGSCLNNVCVKTPTNEGGACDDGLFCTDFDTCTMGTCMGSPKSCPFTDTCQSPSCDESAKMCVTTPVSDGTPCVVPNNVCYFTAFCQSGVCTGGQEMDCSFLDGACSIGTCDAMQGCVSTPAAEGAPCDDGLFCTVNDACHGGTCAGTPMQCPPATEPCQANTCSESTQACESGAAPDGTSCTGTNACLAMQTCSGGACAGGVPANDGMPCTSTSACTTNGACASGVCAGTPVTACVSGDGCCPPGCTLATDSDCSCSVDLALTAVAKTSGGGSSAMYLPAELNNGIGESQCGRYSWIKLDWSTAVTIGSMYIESPEAGGQGTCAMLPGRNVQSGDVQTWSGSAWVTATSFSGESGNIQIDVQPAVTTTKLRLGNVQSSPGNGNSEIFEWHVFGAPGCVPAPD